MEINEMATAKVTITLTLDEDEARFLYTLLGDCVMGTGHWRQVSNRIYDALEEKGCEYLWVHKEQVINVEGWAVREVSDGN
jgi:hypothetical protein